MNKILTAALSTSLLFTFSTSTALAGMVNPETNHASYWGDNCYKTEISGEMKEYSVTDSSITKVIVKGGTDYVVYEDGNFTNLTAPVNPKNKNGTTYGISHIIECEGSKPVDPQEPTEPTDPTDPTDPVKPVDPTEPTDPTDPTDPVKPVDPIGETEEPEVVPEAPEGGKGGPVELPSELPKTGADNANLSGYFTLVTGLSILIALVGYKGALSFINSRLQ